MSCNCFCPKKQKPNLSSIPWISCIYFLATCVGSHLGRSQAPSGVLAFWAHVRHFPSPHDCLMSISHFSSPHGCLLLITFHLHMVASYQSLPISTWLPHVHHLFSPHGCLTSVTSPLQIAASYSSRLISTWLPHAHHSPSPHSYHIFITSGLHCLPYVNPFSSPCRCPMFITSYLHVAVTVLGTSSSHNPKYPSGTWRREKVSSLSLENNTFPRSFCEGFLSPSYLIGKSASRRLSLATREAKCESS